MVRDDFDVNAAYGTLMAHLNAIRRQWRWLRFSAAFLKCFGLLALLITGTLLVLWASVETWRFPFSQALHIGILLLSIGGAVVAVFRTFIRPLRRSLTDAVVAARLEATEADAPFAVENRVLSAVQLWKTLEDNRLGIAPAFVAHLIHRAAADVAQVSRRRVFRTEFRNIRLNAGIAVAGVAALLLTHLFLPTAFTQFTLAFQTLPTPLEVGAESGTASVQITNLLPGHTERERGDDVAVTATVRGHSGAPVSLYYRVGDDGDTAESNAPWHSLPMHADEQEQTAQESISNSANYSVVMENVTRPLRYYVSVAEVASARYQITISDEPIVTRFHYRLNYPAYTELESETLPADVGNLHLLFGTEVVLTAESNKPLQQAQLVFDSSDAVPLTVTTGTPDDVQRIRGSFTAQQTDTYHIAITDTEGFPNPDPVNYTMTVLEDAVPKVALIAPGRDTVLDDAMLVDLKIEATDDYGIQALQLVYRIESEGTEPVTLPLKRWEQGDREARRSVFVEYVWDVDRIGLFPGETMAYYIQALDIDDVSGPNVGKSLTYTLRFPSLSERYDAVASAQESEQRGLDALIDEQADASGLVDTLLDRIRKNQEVTLTDENLMQQVLENQKQIEETAERLLEDMKETAEEMAQNQLFDQETLEKYQELQSLMEQALSEEHKELLQKLAEALSKQQPSEQEQSMAEANLSQEQFLQQLERAKSLYEQILLQQELEAAVKQAQALAEQQQGLMETLEAATASTPLNDLAQREERVAAEFTQLSAKLEEIGTKMAALAENQENAPPQIGRLADEVKRLNRFATEEQRLPETLQRTSEALRKNERTSALESGQEAAQTLTELAQGLDNALEFMEGANANETLTALQSAVESGLHLSHLHEDVLVNTNALVSGGQTTDYIPTEIQRLQQLASDQLTMGEAIAQISSRLWTLGNRQIQVPPEAIWHLNAANDALARAARALEDRQPNLALPIQTTALADLNQAVFELLDAIGEMNQQMDGSGFENMMNQLQQLAEGQEQLNEMAQNLNQQMREQGRTPGLEQMMQQLASQQQRIREAAERLAERAEQMAQMLGSLESVAEDMATVERSLREGELNQDVLDRQSQILTRMLDSLKSLQKRDAGKRRKAEVAERSEPTLQEVPPLHPELLEIVRKLESAPQTRGFEDIPFQYREQLRRYFKALSQRRQ